MPNFTFCEGRERNARQFSFPFPELRYSPLDFNSQNVLQHLKKSPIKFEAERIQFNSHVFVVVAALVLKPSWVLLCLISYCTGNTGENTAFCLKKISEQL